MKCPSCGRLENRVMDSRLNKEGKVIRRRRECMACGQRFTTYERMEENLPQVIKKDGRREPFDMEKLARGIDKACEKRPVSIQDREEIISRVKRMLQETGEKEVPSKFIGEKVMGELYNLDKVAYVRFASVYREFKDIDQFMSEIQEILEGSEH